LIDGGKAQPLDLKYIKGIQIYIDFLTWFAVSMYFKLYRSKYYVSERKLTTDVTYFLEYVIVGKNLQRENNITSLQHKSI